MPAVPGVTATDATATCVTCLTVTAALPLCPSLVAVIVAEPAVTAVTRPLAFTVATDVLVLDQVTARPASVVPFASFGVAVSSIVCPTFRDADAGVTATSATGMLVTVTAAVPLLLPL